MLLQAYAILRDLAPRLANPRFQAIAPGRPFTWTYRGQVLPTDQVVRTERVLARLNQRLTTPAEERPSAPDPEFMARVDALAAQLRCHRSSAVVLNALRRLDDPSAETEALLSGDLPAGLAQPDWLAELRARLLRNDHSPHRPGTPGPQRTAAPKADPPPDALEPDPEQLLASVYDIALEMHPHLRERGPIGLDSSLDDDLGAGQPRPHGTAEPARKALRGRASGAVR